jgi:predicted outer membrane repeat protein
MARARLFALIVIGFAATLFSALPNGPSAFAGPTVLEVDRTDDEASASACTPAASDCSLRGALIHANADSAVQTIELPAGDFDIQIPGAGEDAAATGDLDIMASANIVGAGAGNTTVSGNNLDRVFDLPTQVSGRTVTFEGLTITGGLLPNGGGGGLRSEYSTVNLTDIVIMANSSGFAAGIEAVTSDMTLTRTTITKNGATGNGVGGIYNNSGDLVVVDSTFVFNSGDVGAIANAGGEVDITNSTFSGNTAEFSGGAISTNSTLSLTNVTIAGNSANNQPVPFAIPASNGIGGGGLASYAPFGEVSIKATIIANNTDIQGNPDCAGPISSAGFNLIETISGACDITGITDSNITGVDPMLGLLGDNGGPTQTHALLPGSAAINAGPEDCPPPATDQRGVSRPRGGICDIGAYEFEGPFPLRQGDVNCDGAIDGADMTLLLEYTADLDGGQQDAPCPDVNEPELLSGFNWGDVNCDGTIDGLDALFVILFAALLETPEPADPGCAPVGQPFLN